MDAKGKNSLVSFLIELALYAVLVLAYFFLVLHFMGDWLLEVYLRDKRLYAVVALLLIIAQGVVLEALTTGLLRWIRSKLDRG